ncbi:hypothetical protein A0H81_01074 [Grifola frondosa]|uniref:Uncharacterized protein n=1 Tax=Grifola frondosa TaxID=5627 RepID=A0A1C7MRJ2_GRIFR|nr:hypothetical protein A0H81_01074 [Grifola frondosa]
MSANLLLAMDYNPDHHDEHEPLVEPESSLSISMATFKKGRRRGPGRGTEKDKHFSKDIYFPPGGEAPPPQFSPYDAEFISRDDDGKIISHDHP